MRILAGMPLDAGALAEQPIRGPARRRTRPSLDPNLPIGAALRAARLSLDLSLDAISETTRVRVRHLAAIEAEDLEELPSRPFAIGYIRAYARALGLDADATAARFRAEHPSPDDDLHTPVGVAHQSHPRNWLAIAPICVAVVAIIGRRRDSRALPRRAPQSRR